MYVIILARIFLFVFWKLFHLFRFSVLRIASIRNVVAIRQVLGAVSLYRIVRKDSSLSHRYLKLFLIIFKSSRYLVKTRLKTLVHRRYATLIPVLSSPQRVFPALKIHLYPGTCSMTIGKFS